MVAFELGRMETTRELGLDLDKLPIDSQECDSAPGNKFYRYEALPFEESPGHLV